MDQRLVLVMQNNFFANLASFLRR